jgi:hypothetical protein
MKTVYRKMKCVEACPGFEGLAEDQKSMKSLNRVPSFYPTRKKKTDIKIWNLPKV